MSRTPSTGPSVSARQIQDYTRAATAALAKKFKVTGQPVHRNSRHAGERELLKWRKENVFSAREKRARLKALKRFERRHKLQGKRNGLVGHIAIELYELMLDMRDYRSGRLDPTIGYLANKLKRSVAAVSAAMARLKDHGWLDWYRRTVPVANPDPFGPQVQQTSNAYWFETPSDARAEVREEMASSPMPVDEAQRRADQAAELQGMLAGVSSEDVARFRAGGDGPLAAVLASLGRSLDKACNAIQPNGLNPVQQQNG